MWNVVGISLSFFGTLLTLIGILSVETKNPNSWGALSKSLKSKVEEYWLAVIGLILLSIGYAIQITLAFLEM